MTPPPTLEIALARAIEDLAFAKQTHADGHFSIAISRAYYATLYASMALLASVGMHAKTQDGARTLVNQHFVRSGKLPPETSAFLGEIHGLRLLADYDLAAVFTAEGNTEAIVRTSKFVDDVKAVLSAATGR